MRHKKSRPSYSDETMSLQTDSTPLL